MFYDFSICKKCFMEGFEGGGLADVGNSKVWLGISETGVIGVRTGSKNIPCFCKGSSVRLERMGDWYEEEICFISDCSNGSWNWLFRMWFVWC